MGGNSKSKAQVSAYLMSLHVGFCHSVDKVLEIFVKEKSVVKGNWSTNTTLTIDQKNLFGGEKKEGGLLGGLEIMQGRSDQVMREDLANRLGKTAATAPGFRDILSMFFYGAPGLGFMWSNNYPYLHTIWAKVTRTETGWYSAKRQILLRSSGAITPTVAWDNQYRYKLTYGQTTFGVPSAFTEPGYNDSSWAIGSGGFANNGAAISGRPIGTPIVSGIGNSIWLRKRVTVTGYPADITLTLYHDDGCRLWWNGTELAGPGLGVGTLVIPASLVLSENVVVYQVIDGVPGGTPQGMGADIAVSVGSTTTNEYDMNPAHIIRECLTNTDWGMGLPSSQIDDTAFTEAADTLFAEGFGMSLMWSGQSDIETFVNEVLNHIDATYGVDPATGKIFIKLIRGGYDLGDLEILNEDNCRITQFNRKALDETTNEVVVTWTNPDNEGEETVVVHDLANYAAQGVIVSSSRNYYGIRSSALAIRAALRELNKSAQPIAAFELEASRAAWKFKSGDVVKVSYVEYGLNELPCRITNINYGKPGEMAIKMTLVEDVFEMPDSSYVVTEGSYWEPVVSSPATVSHVYGTTAPYFALARAMGDADASALTSTQAYSFLLTDSPGLVEVFTPTTDAVGSVSYTSAGTVDPCGYGTLGAGLTQEVTSTVTLATNSNRVALASGVFMLIGGQEICIVESVDPLVVRRGMLDTVPQVWASGTSVWIFSWDADLNDETENTVGSTVAYQMSPDGTGGAGSLSASVTFSTRAVKPYRPANVKINTLLWPSVVSGDITVTWAHRNRLMETSVPLKWDEASVTPEAGTTYTVKYYEGITVLKEETVSGTTSTMTILEEGGSSTDPNFALNKVLMPFNGANGSTTMTDIMGNTFTAYGGAVLSTTQSKYGGSSLYLPAAGYVRYPGNIGIVASDDYTMELWFYATAYPNDAVLVWSYTGNIATTIALMIHNSTLCYGFYNDGTTTVSLNAWHHAAVSRVSGTTRWFLDGNLEGTITGDTARVATSPIEIGIPGPRFSGYIDDLRIKGGIGLYTTAFTPPAALPIAEIEHIASTLRVTVEAIRDGIHSEQMFDHTFDRAGYGLQYGNYYGGI